MNPTNSLPADPPRKPANLQGGLIVLVCGLALLQLILPGIAISLVFGLVLLLAWLYLCWTFPFQALCCVAVIGMCQGVVKQLLNWSQIVYIGLDIPWVLFLAVWLIRRVKVEHSKTFGMIDGLLLLFFAWSAIELFNPNLPSKYMAIGALRNRLLPMLFFWVGKDLLDVPRSQRLLIICLIVAGIGGVLGVYEWTLGSAGVAKLGPGFVPRSSTAWRDTTGLGHLRPLSIYQDAGLAAMFSTGMFCVALNLWDQIARKLRPIVIISGLLCVAFVSVSGVRGAVVCGFVGLLTTVLMNYKKALPTAIVVGGFIGILSVFGSSHLDQRYQSLANPLQAYQTNRGHTVTAIDELVRDTPLGYGTGSATTAADTYVNLFSPGIKVLVRTNDNAFAVLMAEGGIPFALLYSALLLCILSTAWKARGSSRPIKTLAPACAVFSTVLIAFSFTNMVIDWQPTNILFWLLTGSLVANSVPERRIALSAPTLTPLRSLREIQ